MGGKFKNLAAPVDSGLIKLTPPQLVSHKRDDFDFERNEAYVAKKILNLKSSGQLKDVVIAKIK